MIIELTPRGYLSKLPSYQIGVIHITDAYDKSIHGNTNYFLHISDISDITCINTYVTKNMFMFITFSCNKIRIVINVPKIVLLHLIACLSKFVFACVSDAVVNVQRK
jgi:hypothetical protein